jgi:hypothetical protein
MSYNTKNYTEQGAERTVIGGEIDIVNDGKLKFKGFEYRHDAAHLSNALQTKALRLIPSQVNAGILILDPGATGQFQILDVKMRAIGGAAGACTSIDLVEETSGDIFFSAPRAALTQNAWVTLTTANVVSTKTGVWSTVGKKLNLVVVGDPVTTSTHFDVIVTYIH